MSVALRRALLLGIFFVAGCAAPRPVLYPNTHLQQVGRERARTDIAACVQYARQVVHAHPDSRAVGRAATASSMHSLFSWNELSPLERNYTDMCLRRRGYLPIGWK